MSAVIAPTVLAETTDQFKQSMEKIHQLADRVHIDISDGEFAPTFTINATEAWWPEGWHADIHAMVARPSEYVEYRARHVLGEDEKFQKGRRYCARGPAYRSDRS